jgi:hypothetical protein
MNFQFFKYSIVNVLKAVVLVQVVLTLSLYAQSFSPYAYDIGSPSVVDYYVDPVKGSNFNSSGEEMESTVVKVEN